MGYLPKTRVFKGERFRLYNDYLKRGTAEWEAGKLRSKGWRTKVIRLLGLYGVYKRR